MSNYSLIVAALLLIAPVFISSKEKLGIEKDIVISVIRAVIQLFLIGYVLEYVFNLKNNIVTIIIILFLLSNAALNTRSRGENIKKPGLISFVSIGISTFITLSIILYSKAIEFEPNQVITISAMVISNSMIAMNLCYKNINKGFKDNKSIVEAKLSLGSNTKLASKDIIHDSIKMSMMPSIDSAKTVGIVSLPGTMTGLILAGQSPLMAIKYQILVTFMLLSVTSISTILGSYLSYRSFFNDRDQLIDL